MIDTIFKSGDKYADPNNYRGITLLNVIGEDVDNCYQRKAAGLGRG